MIGTPRDTGTPNSFRIALAWYSCTFMGTILATSFGSF